jgi:hypothetical protein
MHVVIQKIKSNNLNFEIQVSSYKLINNRRKGRKFQIVYDISTRRDLFK